MGRSLRAEAKRVGEMGRASEDIVVGGFRFAVYLSYFGFCVEVMGRLFRGNWLKLCLEAFLEEGSFKAAGRREDAELGRHDGLCTNLFDDRLIRVHSNACVKLF